MSDAKRIGMKNGLIGGIVGIIATIIVVFSFKTVSSLGAGDFMGKPLGELTVWQFLVFVTPLMAVVTVIIIIVTIAVIKLFE